MLALQMQHISKSFPGVRALSDVSFDLRPGEVHALVGENGAGKSTLMKILAGAISADQGDILIDDKPVNIANPAQAIAAGVGVIYQEFNLVPHLSVAENIFLGREPRNAGFIRWGELWAGAQRELDRIEARISPRSLVAGLSVAQQQLVEIAKALSLKARIIVMDEPSATLTDHELLTLFAIISTLKQEGVSVVYISHRLEEIFEVADRVTVLRDGQHVATEDVANLTREDIVRMMIGRELETVEFTTSATPRPLLQVEGLTRAVGEPPLSLTLHEGEILGIAGLVGAGRTEFVRAVFGADRPVGGSVTLDGVAVPLGSVRAAIRRGIGLVPEDRKQQGLILDMAIRENITLANLKAVASGGFVRPKAERHAAEGYVDDLRIATPSIEQKARNLSGGTQQKVALAKWLFTKCKVLIFDEPTRGVDVGAKGEIHEIMRALARQGAGIIMISSELPEVLKMSDRVIVMREGHVTGEVPRAEATQERIMTLATGGR
jgi:ribose transport system ATP-binding protein